MVDFGTVAVYAFIASLAVYLLILFKQGSSEKTDSYRIEQLEKIAQYFSATQSLEKALRQIVKEQPESTSTYEKIIKKVDEGANLEAAIYQTEQETNNEFISKICTLLISINRSDDPSLLYKTVQKMKEASGIEKEVRNKSEVGSWIIQFVFCIIMPLILFFMIGTLGVEADIYLNGFLAFIVLAGILFQGIVFRQWLSTLIKIPLIFSIFYLLYFVLAPKFFSGMMGPML